MKKEVEISFVIPCFNPGVYLSETIQSILNQEPGPFSIQQIIIVNDRSTDPITLNILEELSKTPGILVIDNTHFRGPGGARNCGAEKATADWLAFFDADDILPPASLKIRTEALLSQNDQCFIGGDFVYWWGQEKFEPEPFLKSRPRPAKTLATAFSCSQPTRLEKPVLAFVDTFIASCCTTLIPHATFKKVGGFDESLMHCEDQHFFIRLAAESDYLFIPQVVMWYRQNPNSLTHQQFSPSDVYAKALRLLLQDHKFKKFWPQIKNKLVDLDIDSAYWYRSRGSFEMALQRSWSAIKHSFFQKVAWKEFLGAVFHLK